MSFYPGSMSNGQQSSADTHVPKTAAEFAATDKAGMIAPSDVRGGRASRETIARTIQQIWQGPSGRPWDGTPDGCCVKFPPQAEWFRRVADAILALAPQEGTSRGGAERDAIIEECAKVAEAQAQAFLSPQYATNQPFGSICERFACEEVAKAIRSLALPSAQSKSEGGK